MSALSLHRTCAPALLAAALAVLSGCKESKPPAAEAAPAAEAPAAASASPAPEPAPAAQPAPAPAPAPAPPAEPAPEVTIAKSEELRFVEATARILCFERDKRRQPKDKERSAILAEHGFKGKTGNEVYTQLNLRGDRDKEWGKRVLEKIKFEMDERCPLKPK